MAIEKRIIFTFTIIKRRCLSVSVSKWSNPYLQSHCFIQRGTIG